MDIYLTLAIVMRESLTLHNIIIIIYIEASRRRLLLWAHRDLNPEPADYESVALTN